MLEFFPQLLSLAQQLLRHGAEAVAAAGGELYCLLFKHFSAAYNQQEVLRALHSHLGAQVAAEASAALDVLLRLSQQHTAALAGFAAFLTNILDYIEAYTDSQVHQVGWRVSTGQLGQQGRGSPRAWQRRHWPCCAVPPSLPRLPPL